MSDRRPSQHSTHPTRSSASSAAAQAAGFVGQPNYPVAVATPTTTTPYPGESPLLPAFEGTRPPTPTRLDRPITGEDSRMTSPQTPRGAGKRPADVLSPLAQRPPPNLRLEEFEQALRLLPPTLKETHTELMAATGDPELSSSGVAVAAAGFLGQLLATTHTALSSIWAV